MYKLLKEIRSGKAEVFGAIRDNQNGTMTSFVFVPDNTDYDRFKTQILEATAELQDADGNLMTEQQARDFVNTLP
jgi:hypothetical protein